MDIQVFQRWLAQLSQLSVKQKATLQQALCKPPQQAVLEGYLPDMQNCPHCYAEATPIGALGLESRTSSLSLSSLRSDLQCADGDRPGAFAQSPALAGLHPSLDRWPHGAPGGSAMRHQQEHGLSLAPPLSGRCIQTWRPAWTRHCRGGRDVLSRVL